MTTPERKAILSGNQAIARGALEAGVRVAASYPGTPSTEILETLALAATERHIHAEWSTNEKVAFEVATAGALCGLRSIVSMKQPGVNWIADPLMVVNLSGVRGGLVIVACDDPGCHSSANEQDSRFYSLLSETIVLEPADPQEAKDMTKAAFELSEKIELPVFIRSVTRVSHSRGDVTLLDLPPIMTENGAFERDPDRFWISGIRGLRRHFWLHQQQGKIRGIVDKLPFNKIEHAGSKSCIVTSGVAYNYVKEAAKLMGIGTKVDILKIGSPYPLPEKLVRKALSGYTKLLVVEEGEPFLEFNLKVLSAETARVKTAIFGRHTGYLEPCGELNTETVCKALAEFIGKSTKATPAENPRTRKRAIALLPERTMTFCPGCPHRSTLFALKKVIRRKATARPIIVGDIGCYALSILPPYEVGDVKYSMGSSIGISSGLSYILKDPVVAIVGDSTFFHASIPALINANYNGSNITVIVLDNVITGMTGGQPHPGVGITATGKKTKRIVIEDVARSCGADHVDVVDSFETGRLEKVMERRIGQKGVNVIVSRGLCALRPSIEKDDSLPMTVEVNEDRCTGCLLCVKQFGCPAIMKTNGKACIEGTACNGCGACISICPHEAIESSTRMKTTEKRRF